MDSDLLREADNPECDNCGIGLERDMDDEGRCNACGAPIPPWEPMTKKGPKGGTNEKPWERAFMEWGKEPALPEQKESDNE